MTLDENIAFCIAEGNAFKGSNVYYRKDWERYRFNLIGKYFALLVN